MKGVTGLTANACEPEGKVKSIELNKSEAIVSLDNGLNLSLYKNSFLMPMVNGSLKTGRPICISNLAMDDQIKNLAYPGQIVATFDVKEMKSNPRQMDCVKRGYIKRAISNSKYDWFYLENGFVMRVVHISKVTPKLYEAAFNLGEVCVTKMDLSGSGPTWGIPRKVEILWN